MKKILNWITGDKSDFILFIILLVLLNIVSLNLFARLDLTSSKSYSLSNESKQLVKTLEQPLSVKVFFTENLPSPYNTVGQYLKDLLIEYKGEANKNFSFEFFDTRKEENAELAGNYMLQQVQIQEVSDTEVGLKNAYMGLVLIYADRIEKIDGLTSADGLEYKLTTSMSKMVATTSALSGLDGEVNLTLYLNSELDQFNISGFSSVETSVVQALSSVNSKNMNRIRYEKITPAETDIASLSEQYGIQMISWKDEASRDKAGALGLVLSYKDTFRLVPLKIVRGFFGGFGVTGIEELEQNISEGLKALVSRSTEIGYVTGHYEKDLSNTENGSANFAKMNNDMYSFKELDLVRDEIPGSITNLIINGPQTEFADEELYKIDQFLMRGGNLSIFLDPYNEVQGEMSQYSGMPEFVENNTRLETLLEKYGVRPEKKFVLDSACYTSNQQGYGTLNFYYIPLLHKDTLDQKNPISSNLSYVLMYQMGQLTLTDSAADDKKVTVLAKSSPKAWTVSGADFIPNPMYLSVPSDDTLTQENLVILLEGKFESAFDKAPEQKISGDDNSQKQASLLSADNHLSKSVQNGKVLIAGGSYITGQTLIDEYGSQPISLFVRNAVDYMNGNEDLCIMRTKGLGLNVLKISNQKQASFVKSFNTYGLPLLIALGGLIVWRLRVVRRKKIQKRYMGENA
ncbi:MAG TPA: Gldg family protein [Treponemataceae bacterium]|nr:Gldg family protein [Treponemataceae bacterium]HQL04662.1 Gldg family protein [Treponemataceae bacterium]